MTRVLVADTDPLLVSAVLRGLEQLRLEAAGCTSEVELERCLRTESFDLVILDCDFVQVQERHLGLARVVLTVSYLSEAVERRFFRHFGLLKKPFTSVELTGVIKEELGWLDSRQSSLVAALSLACRNRNDVCVAVRTGSALGRIHVEGGEIVHAACGELEGEPALLSMLTRPSAVREGPLQERGLRTIHRTFRDLVLGLLGEIDQDEQREMQVVRSPRTTQVTRSMRRVT